MKKSKYIIRKRSEAKTNKDQVLFGFENIKGFSVDMDEWCYLINILINIKADTKAQFDKVIVQELNRQVESAKEEGYYHEDLVIVAWDQTRDLETYLAKRVFIKNDQIVVPSLNLKSAKKIICRNEKQKKKLRKMGFIEDRILIKNVKRRTF